MSRKRAMLDKIQTLIAGFSLEYLGVLCDLVEKLSGENKSEGVKELKKFLRQEPCWVTGPMLKLGTYKSIATMRKTLKAGGFMIDSLAGDILRKVSLSSKVKEIELVAGSVADLGFKNGACFRDIATRIQDLGFELCPAEAGPQLMLQYVNQAPKYMRLHVAMAPLTGSDGRLFQFSVTNHGGYGALEGIGGGDTDSNWPPATRWVYVRPKKRP